MFLLLPTLLIAAAGCGGTALDSNDPAAAASQPTVAPESALQEVEPTADAQETTPSQIETPLPAAEATANPGDGDNAQPTTTPSPAPPPEEAEPAEELSDSIDYPAGALIGVTMESQVGVLLDEFPDELRDEVAADLLGRDEQFWLDRARRQTQMTYNRLNFRNFKYADKGQLPLPPEELWSFTLDEAGPQRQTIQGHDLVMVGYSFSSTLLTDAASPEEAEPALAEEGGIWEEPFVFPADPEQLLQRTSNACVNEAGYPPNSFDSQNAHVYFDFSCTADSTGAAGCHRTNRPQFSCREALEARVGEVQTAIRFERLPWDQSLADAVRLGPLTSEDAPDLLAVNDDLNTNYISYRYIPPEDCNLEEGAVGGSGWRRLLQFTATVHNTGAEALDIGPVVAEDEHNVFQYSPCHAHFHYSNYGDFLLGELEQAQASKQAFCVQSTSRYSNNELSPLIHAYSCNTQGIQAGWVDEYIAGLDAQWMDITEVEIPAEGLSTELSFVSNENQFLCEGQPVLDESGQVIWQESEFLTEDGEIIKYPQCDFIPDWQANNTATTEVFIPQQGSYVTSSCANGQLGPLRDCGFEALPVEDATCTPGETVQLSISLDTATDLGVLRVCEASEALGGVACALENALTNRTVGPGTTTVSFQCPVVRDSEDARGGYSLYSAAVWPTNASQPVVLENGD